MQNKKFTYICLIIVLSISCGFTSFLLGKIENLEDEIEQLRNDIGQLMGPDGDM